MSGIATAVVAGSVITGAMSSKAQKSAASTAASAQTEASEASIEEQRRQFDKVVELLKPYVEAGQPALEGLAPYAEVGAPALSQLSALTGLGGAAAQRAAIQQIETSPEMQAMIQQGEEAILQRASATGGLRGGNVQAALAQFRPQVLSQLIGQQYQRLGGLADIGRVTQQNIAQMGQAAAAGQAATGMQSAANVGNLLGQIGQAQAGQALAAGQANAQMWGNIGGTIGQIGTMKLLGMF